MANSIFDKLQTTRPSFQFAGSKQLAKILSPLLSEEEISKTDWRFAALMEQFGESDVDVLIVAAKCSSAIRAGSTCISVSSDHGKSQDSDNKHAENSSEGILLQQLKSYLKRGHIDPESIERCNKVKFSFVEYKE